MKTIVFRITGGQGIGYGHYFRSYSLAKALNRVDSGLKIVFIINKQLSDHLLKSEFEYLISESFEEDIFIIAKLRPRLLVLDTYMANDDYLIKVKRITKLMIFDDNNDIYDSTIPDILLNGNIHADKLDYNKEKNSLYLLGPSYLVMREEYWTENVVEYERKDGILITTGGTDPYKISHSILTSLRQLPFKKRVIIGPGYEQGLINKLEESKDEKTELIYMPKSLKKYLRESIVAITACGSTTYEVISQNTIPIIFSMANNQDKVCKYLASLGVLSIGKYPQIKYRLINKNIIKFIKQKSIYNYEVHSLVDGLGAKKASQIICSFLD